MAESRSLRIARLREEIQRKRKHVQLMQIGQTHMPEERKDELELQLQNEEISAIVDKLHQLEVQLIRESLKG
jgi:hypothetical protein